MATYIPNATQTTEPVESRTVESAALEFRTLKSSINARIEDVQDNLDAEVVNRIAGDANLQTQNNAQDVRLTAVENALLAIGEGGLPGTVYVQRLSGTGAQTVFTLNAAPQSGNVVDIYINGIYQNKDTFTVAGANITFSEAPPAGTNNIEVQVTITIALGETDASLVTYDGTTVAAQLDVVDAQLAAFSTPSGASLINFQQSGAGAVVRTTQDKLRESVSVKDFGAVGDGVADDTAAIQAAIDAVYLRGGGAVLLGKSHKISAQIQLKPHVRVVGAGASVCRIETTQATGVIFQVVRPAGYIPSLVMGVGLSGVTVVGSAGLIGVDFSECRGGELKDVEFGVCNIGLAFNYKATADGVPFGGQSYFNVVTQCAFASCTTAVKFYGAANRNTFSTNTYTNCTVAFDFSAAGNVAETNVFINENVEGCHSWAEWGASIYGQTWVGLTVENPTTNGYVCTVKDPGRQVFVNLGIIPYGNALAVDFYKINANYSTLFGSQNSSGGSNYGTRIVEELQLFGGVRNHVRHGSAVFSTAGLGAGTSATTTISVPGASVGDFVKVSANKDLLGCVAVAWVSATDVVTVRIQNASGGNVALSSVEFTAIIEKLGY